VRSNDTCFNAVGALTAATTAAGFSDGDVCGCCCFVSSFFSSFLVDATATVATVDVDCGTTSTCDFCSTTIADVGVEVAGDCSLFCCFTGAEIVGEAVGIGDGDGDGDGDGGDGDFGSSSEARENLKNESKETRMT
jgi:hypothetical protein